MPDEELEPGAAQEPGTSAGDATPAQGHPSPALAAAEPRLGPVAGGERVAAVDTLRGFALLGILPMNVYAFAMPLAAYGNPLAYGGLGLLDRGTWVATHLFFDQKFMTLFSMLFGAGLALMHERAGALQRQLRSTYYRRQLWLLLIGAVHAYLLWFGDILFGYALTGMLIYPLRRRSPRALIVIGCASLLVAPLLGTGMGLQLADVRRTVAEADARSAAGQPLDKRHEEARASWAETEAFMAPSAAEVARQVAVHRGGYGGIVAERAPLVVMMQTAMMPLMIVWRVGGLMLIGMALMKLGVFSAQRSDRFYRACVALGYALGLPLSALSAQQLNAHAFDPVYVFKLGGYFNYFGSIAVSFGHLGAVMLVCRSGLWPAARARLGAVGRMALTNYLAHTLLLTTVFYGYGFGLFGHVGRFAQMGFVLAVWALQLAWSPLWLQRWRFGPFEWAWRSLTYGRLQPMRARA